MEVTFVYLMWFTALVFTLASFIWRQQLFFPMFAAVLWTATAMGTVQMDFVGFGSMNVIHWNHELGDWYGDVGVLYLLHGLGITMFIYTLSNALLLAKGTIMGVDSGRDVSLDDPRGWN